MILVIDNYDSFVYNLVQYIGTIRKKIKVVRNDKVTIKQITGLKPKAIVISPGPGRPEQAGISIDIIKTFSGKIPILGVCLGHQCLGIAYGAKVVRAKEIYHGKVSKIKVTYNTRLFAGIGKTFSATRYHSLVIDPRTIKAPLIETARTSNGRYVMGVEVKGTKTYGVQFHPESIETVSGMAIIRNFLKVVR